jgi:hypothetical protein
VRGGLLGSERARRPATARTALARRRPSTPTEDTCTTTATTSVRESGLIAGKRIKGRNKRPRAGTREGSGSAGRSLRSTKQQQQRPATDPVSWNCSSSSSGAASVAIAPSSSLDGTVAHDRDSSAVSSAPNSEHAAPRSPGAQSSARKQRETRARGTTTTHSSTTTVILLVLAAPRHAARRGEGLRRRRLGAAAASHWAAPGTAARHAWRRGGAARRPCARPGSCCEMQRGHSPPAHDDRRGEATREDETQPVTTPTQVRGDTGRKGADCSITAQRPIQTDAPGVGGERVILSRHEHRRRDARAAPVPAPRPCAVGIADTPRQTTRVVTSAGGRDGHHCRRGTVACDG